MEGGKAEGGRGIDIAQECGGPGERGEEEWVVARDLSRSKLNLSSSLLLRPRPLCPWMLSADSAGFVFVPFQKAPRLQPYYKSLPKDFTRNFFYSDCPLKKKKNSEKQTAEVPNYIQNKYISLNVLMGDDEAEDDPAERDAAVVMGENRAAAAFMFHSLHLISPSVNLHCSVNMILSQHSPNKPFPFTSPSRLPISLSIQQCGAVLNSYAALCIFSVALSPRGAKAHLLAGLVWQSWLRHIQNSTLA